LSSSAIARRASTLDSMTENYAPVAQKELIRIKKKLAGSGSHGRKLLR
jgi:hypothetical protein